MTFDGCPQASNWTWRSCDARDDDGRTVPVPCGSRPVSVRKRGPVAAVPGGWPQKGLGAVPCLQARTAPRPIEDWRPPMERYHRTVRALGRLAARVRAWRDEIAARPIDPDGWWR
ncbi:hypothetical protein Athai_62710 [Actinocatenispora thailandica]|uniref:Uncharacterized protein n=1 Tax=Actinocatenispora thailandica TaxID=227318 RepID=A0A7R7I172_9ACTN|nr:hypothetical protein Athai_62710 [Actinocatenispora thailandica]